MRWAILGTGAAGGYLGGRLAHAGEDVTFLARPPHLAAIRRDGLRVDSVDGGFVIKPAKAAAAPAEVGPVDVIVLGVKAWQVAEAAKSVKPMLEPQTAILPLQNGVDAADRLVAEVGREHVLGGACHLVARLAGAGHVDHFALAPRLEVGELDAPPSARANAIAEVFRRAGVNTELPENIRSAMWMKLLRLAPISALGAVTRTPIALWRLVPECKEIAGAIAGEIVAVGRAKGVPLPEDALQIVMKMIDMLDPKITLSMQRDIETGRPSELDDLLGVIVRLGTELGVPTPTTRFIHACLLPTEQRARAAGP